MYCQAVDYRQLGSYRCSCILQQLQKLPVALCEEFLECRYYAQLPSAASYARTQEDLRHSRRPRRRVYVFPTLPHLVILGSISLGIVLHQCNRDWGACVEWLVNQSYEQSPRLIFLMAKPLSLRESGPVRSQNQSFSACFVPVRFLQIRVIMHASDLKKIHPSDPMHA